MAETCTTRKDITCSTPWLPRVDTTFVSISVTFRSAWRMRRIRRGERMSEPRYSVAERALEKQRSREEDTRALSSGEIDRDALRARNGVFGFSRARAKPRFDLVKRFG